MPYDVPQLLAMTAADLDALFSSSPAGDILRNRILPIGLNAIIAKVYKGPSWLDQKECVVLDYSETSLVAHWIRDEIRLIGPHFYLGRVYWANKPLIHFCLQFGEAAGPVQS